jgi:hypothetical protein
MVSAAICRGPGTAAFNCVGGATGSALATGGATAAAAPIKPAPFKKLRRAASGDDPRFGMASSRKRRQRSRDMFPGFVRLAGNPRINLQLEAKDSDFRGFSEGRPRSWPVACNPGFWVNRYHSIGTECRIRSEVV